MGARSSSLKSLLSDIDYPSEKCATADSTDALPTKPSLLSCGCVRDYPPASASKPFNDTPKNRAAITAIAGRFDLSSKDSITCTDANPESAVFELPGGLWLKVVKYGTGHADGLAEASTMRWVARHTTIPVPQVISAFRNGDFTYILMRAIPGRKLWWRDLDEAQKERVCVQLKAMIDELRAIPPPPGVGYANVDGGPLFAGPVKIEWDDDSLVAPSDIGPCDSHAALNHQLGRHIWAKVPFDGSTCTESAAEKYLCESAHTSPVFTHGNLLASNVYIDKSGTITGITGWQGAGWWPAYWEYAHLRSMILSTVFSYCDYDQDPSFLTPYPEELEVLSKRKEPFSICSC